MKGALCNGNDGSEQYYFNIIIISLVSWDLFPSIITELLAHGILIGGTKNDVEKKFASRLFGGYGKCTFQL
jgi:hypothetical protein